MTSPLTTSSGTFHALRLTPGENLATALRAVFTASGAGAMAIVTCVGSLTDVRIRHANAASATAYCGHFEITSLVGTIDAQGEHLHLSIADPEGRTQGGHLMSEGSAVYTTAEIVVVALPSLTFRREPCPLSGYRELVITERPAT